MTVFRGFSEPIPGPYKRKGDSEKELCCVPAIGLDHVLEMFHTPNAVSIRWWCVCVGVPMGLALARSLSLSLCAQAYTAKFNAQGSGPTQPHP